LLFNYFSICMCLSFIFLFLFLLEILYPAQKPINLIGLIPPSTYEAPFKAIVFLLYMD
jgi:hypothetical protein